MKKLIGFALLPLLACATADPGTDDAGTGDDGATTDDTSTTDETTPPPPPNAPLATGLAITDIAFFQGVKIQVVKNGNLAAKNGPVVAGRKGLVRVYVNPSGSFKNALTGVLTLTTAGSPHTFTASLTPSIASTDANFASTFNFNVDGPSIGTDSTFLVQIKDPKGTGTGDPSAQFPTSGTATNLGAKSSGSTVKITVFPIHFTAGGSTAATGASDIAAYQQIVLGMYPTPDVQITVGSTLSYGGAIPTAGGSNWGQLLSALQQKRAGDPSPDVYYYGAFAPTSTFAGFCSNGCVAGLSGIPNSPADYTQKASIGLVYGGDANSQQATGQTMAHEVGHGHGREHSPTSQAVQGCATPSGIDPGFPYNGGGIGVWGYDITTTRAFDPSLYYDVMGYCAYDWISDYTYDALFSWVAADNGASIMNAKARTYRMLLVDGDGNITLGDAFTSYSVVSGTPRTVTFTDGSGHGETKTGYYTPFDHIPGGEIVVAEPGPFNVVAVPELGKNATAKTH